MYKMIAAALLVSVLAGCSDPTSAIRAVEASGMDNVQTTGYRWLGCGRDYTFHTGFEARNIRGQKVTGVACSGWFIGTAVKFD